MSKKKIKTNFGFATKTIHAGARPEPVTGARNTPIYQTTSYVFDNTEHAKRLFSLQILALFIQDLLILQFLF